MTVLASDKASERKSTYQTAVHVQDQKPSAKPAGPNADILDLQRAAGNRAVDRLFNSDAGSDGVGADQFMPSTQEGQRLIANRSTHVVPQSGVDEIRADQGNEKRGLSEQAQSRSPQLDARRSPSSPDGDSLTLPHDTDNQAANGLINADKTEKTSIHLGRWVHSSLWLVHILIWPRRCVLGIRTLRKDLEGTEASEVLLTRAHEWIEQAETWETLAQRHADGSLDPFTLSQVRPLFGDLQNILEEFAGLNREAKERRDLQMARRVQVAAKEAAAHVKELEPELNRAMREAFRKEKPSLIEAVASKSSQVLDIGLRLHDLGRMRLEGVKEGERVFEGVAKGLETLSRALAIITAAFALTGEKKTTALEEGARGLEVVIELFASASALAGASLAPHIGLYVNVYLLPLVKKIMEGLEVLVDVLHDINKEWVQLTGEPLYKGVEPGPGELFPFMTTVMHAKQPGNIPIVPPTVAEFLVQKRELLAAGVGGEELPIKGIFWKDLNEEEIRDWLFYRRDRIWAMLYGDWPVPKQRGSRSVP